ncbi:hypothetical protein A5658_00535 [Mycobacterium sp. 1245111.1]|uniref:hypothetical protein n=1 Tax=Mycobacterium sp. 1245111.1 TaxID=1834073 RepID=UPI0007FBF535|nr:hypothetical protein [Mycobacterium sp. 1245111.1]OBK37314.1 hypothetical protein A5658_00535 [Mycobacterium sp. 1245111.1]
MSINDQAGTVRQFVASREAFSTAWITGTKIWQAVYTVVFVGFVGFAVTMMYNTARGAKTPHIPRYTGLYVIAVLLGVSAVFGVYMLWRWRQKYVLTVTGDTLTVAPRGEVYSLADARLGIWPNIGVALHMQSGGHRFVLGGEERSIGPATRLDAEPTELVDARLPASEFDELLRLGGRAAARGPAPGEPTRCILFPNSQTITTTSPFAFRKKQRLVNSLGRAQLFIDVDNDTIRVVEPETHAVDASAAVSRITATPLSYEQRADESNRVYRTPVLTLSVPGLAPLTFGCALSGQRFAWTGSARLVKDPPAYVLSAADWRTLIEKFALGGLSADAARKS